MSHHRGLEEEERCEPRTEVVGLLEEKVKATVPLTYDSFCGHAGVADEC